MPVGLHHIAILCREKERSLRFYETLGFQTAGNLVREGRDEIIWLKGCGIVLELFAGAAHPTRPTDPEAFGLRHLALVTEDAEKDAIRLKDAGYAPEPIRLDAVTGEKMFFVKDPDGLPIELHEQEG